jgi:hypothetical protein
VSPRKASAASQFDWRGFLLLCAIFLALAFLWNTAWVYPLKLFVVLLHEVSHGLAALATGGRIDEIRVFREEGGRTITTGGSAYLITSAGYLGSMLFGVTLLLVSTRTRHAPWLAMALGIAVVAVALTVMPAEGKWFAAGCGLLLAALAPLPRWVPEIVLRVVAVASCLYAILDIKSDVLDRRDAPSDDAAMAKMTGTHPVLWGALWIALSLVVTAVAAKWSVTGSRPRQLQSAAKR